eukprot:634960-Pleurochrysis_carterae.AAC.3
MDAKMNSAGSKRLPACRAAAHAGDSEPALVRERVEPLRLWRRLVHDHALLLALGRLGHVKLDARLVK